MKKNGGVAKIASAVLAGAMVPFDPTSLGGAVEWFNSKAVTAAKLHGKVVVVQFWTYTCVNWRRTLPYIRAWVHKYKASGLVVIGIHTPEFGFEKNLDNVRRAIRELRIGYPVAVDSSYAIWNAFGNEYWPALYFIDARGRMRGQQFGEGKYDEAERTIQELLAEAGHAGFDRNIVSVEPRGLEVAADWGDVQSQETYVGHGRGDPRVYAAAPLQMRLNDWALLGNWSVGKEAAVLNKANGRIAYQFHARDLNLVMGPERPGRALRFRVLLDGKPPGGARGGDIDGDGYGSVSLQQTYQLIRQRKPIADRHFEIEFLEPGVEVFDFTFG